MSETNIEVEIRGVAPQLWSNGQLSNPLNEFAQAIKKISGKKKKTETDYAEMARLEFMGGLYTGEDGGPVVPGEVIDACIASGAAKRKLKTAFKACVFTSDPEYKLSYKGPRDPAKLWEMPEFRDTRRVCIQKKSVQRTRPRFNDWSLRFNLTLLDGAEVTVEDVREAIETAGRLVGLSDFRPKFGRFVVERFKARS